MIVEYDPKKSDPNVKLRGFGLEVVEAIEWETAVTFPDNRRHYGEVRYEVTALSAAGYM